MLEVLKDYNVIAILFTLIVTILNTFLIQWKTRKTKAEKELLKAQKDLNNGFTPNDYYVKIKIDDIYLYFNSKDVEYIKKDTLSIDDYMLCKDYLDYIKSYNKEVK